MPSCSNCGIELFDLACKIICPNCGQREDCSDAVLPDYELFNDYLEECPHCGRDASYRIFSSQRGDLCGWCRQPLPADL